MLLQCSFEYLQMVTVWIALIVVLVMLLTFALGLSKVLR